LVLLIVAPSRGEAAVPCLIEDEQQFSWACPDGFATLDEIREYAIGGFMKASFTLIPLFCLLAGGCVAETHTNTNTDAGHNHNYIPDSGQNNNTNENNNTNWQPPLNSRVYVNTEAKLYYIDPGESDEMVEVGSFQGPCTNGSGFYDIAVDENKNIMGIAAEGLYSINPQTAACISLFEFPQGSPHFFSLSYVKGVDPEDPDADKLIAASVEEGEWVLIDWPGEHIENIFVHLGYYDPAQFEWLSSGDIVSVKVGADTFKTYATLKCQSYTDPGCESDWLAEIDPETGHAQLIGQTGYQQIFGLGFWGETVYGFTQGGEYITIDVDTGQGTLVREFQDRLFWGAGNTTIPHVVR
jgi:hypothetical protein